MNKSVISSVLVAVLFLAAGLPASGQDRVVLRRGGYAGRITVTGMIDDYTGEEIRIRSAQADLVRRYPAAEVVSIETPQTESHDRGLALLADGNTADGSVELETALKKEQRAWVRREILAQLVRCALRLGDRVRAGTRFLAIVKSDPTTRHFSLIPLVWAAEPDIGEAAGQALQWMDSTDETAQLLGASLLFDDASRSAAARSTMRLLAKSVDPRVRSLAQLQAWRHELSEGPPGELQIIRWQERVDELPSDLRSGPSYLLGRAYALRHDHELAAATLLWLPLVDDHDFQLAARAGLEAGVSLTKIGQVAEGRALFREVVERFADTPAAKQAQVLLHAAAEKESP